MVKSVRRPVKPESASAAKPLRIPYGKLRKLAVSQQGLLKNNSFGKGIAAVESVISHIGYVQIDTISVVERAHHHVLHSRVSDYKPEYLATLVEQQKIFEYWFHAAAYLPIDDFRFALPRMESIRSGEKHWFGDIDKKLVRSVYKRIDTEGPLLARDFVDTRKTNTGWWDWKPAKQALEKLFMQGDLMVVGREGFQKRYDLTEKVLPAHISTATPDVYEQARYLIRTNIRAHGFFSLKSVTYLRKGKPLRDAVKECLDSLIDQKELLFIQTPAGDQYYADPGLLERQLRTSARAKFLSPFDNLLIQRERCRQIFDFDYQIECYVPQPKRQYGYFCLPVLFKDRLLGRADIKADRKESVLRIVNLQFETANDLPGDLVDALCKTIRDFMAFNNCRSVAVERVANAGLKKTLQATFKRADLLVN